MMLDAFNGRDNNNFWVNVSGKATLVSSYKTPSLTAEFKNNLDSLSNIPDQYLTFVKNHCLDWDETETHIFVHANVDPDLPLHKQSDHDLFWQKLYPRPSHYSGKIVVCGHTSQKDGYPVNMGHQICIDTWACGRGWLTCLDVDTGEIWQTNQKGKLLTGNINNCSNVSIN